jgi:GNAT superfamily N-acetyltransferase
VLTRYADEARAWAAVDNSGQSIGYILVDIIDGGGHIEQVSVVPARQGQGVGRASIERLESWATSKNLRALTLTTFEHSPWNRPLYEHFAFRVLTHHETGPGVQKIREAEADHALAPALMAVMRLDLLQIAQGCSL